MSKIDTVRAAMMQAMKDKDKARKDALSLLLSALKNKVIDKRADLTEDEENAVIFREIKQAQETIDTTPEDRVQTIEEAKLRMSVYSEFMPSRQGVTIVLLMTDWKTMDAPPMAKAVMQNEITKLVCSYI